LKELALIEMQQQEQSYWWHVSRRFILQTILARHAKLIVCHSGTPHPTSPYQGEERRGSCSRQILDVGCGTGANFEWLSKFGDVTGVEINKTAVELAHHEGKVAWGRAEDLPVEDSKFDLVVALDVLEHLSDETRAIKEWGRVLCPHGKLFIAVPAYQGLFGPHDRALEHYRRYSLCGLNKLLRQNGFHPIFSTHIFCLTFPLFLIQRWLAKRSSVTKSQYISVPSWTNNILIGLGKIEAIWLKWFKFPFGSSIVILAKKDD